MTCKRPCDRFILTGPLHCGKSTLVRSVIAGLYGKRLGGFYTSPLIDQQPAGFQLCSWRGECRPFVHFRDRSNAAGCGGRIVDEQAFSELGVRLLRESHSADSCVLDELGIMECGVCDFVQQVRQLAAATVPLLAVIQERALAFWLPCFPQERIRMYVMNENNRTAMTRRLAKEMSEQCL